MRVLVTGGTGFTGSHCVRELLAAGHEVRLLARSREKVARVFAGNAALHADAVIGDVTDPAAVAEALDGAEAVVHTAAVVAVEARRAREVLDTNFRAVELVVGGACERGIGSVVYVSSLGALFQPGRPISEDCEPVEASSPYARSKADGESYVRRLQARGAPVRTVYPPAIIGPDDPGLSEGNHTVGVFLNQMMVDTDTGFEMVDVRDLARVIARLAEPDTESGRYVMGGHYHRWTDLIALLDELTGRRVRRIRIPGRTLRALGRVGDAVKHVIPFDFPLAGEAMDFATQWPGVVPSPRLEALGLPRRDPRATWEETIRWLHAAGHLTAKQVGKLAE